MKSTSPRFTLDIIDWLKVGRFLAVQLAGLVATYAIPFLSGFSYTLGGHDLTPFALICFSGAGELLRRFVTDHTT